MISYEEYQTKRMPLRHPLPSLLRPTLSGNLPHFVNVKGLVDAVDHFKMPFHIIVPFPFPLPQQHFKRRVMFFFIRLPILTFTMIAGLYGYDGCDGYYGYNGLTK
jgi:hypothetical protein